MKGESKRKTTFQWLTPWETYKEKDQSFGLFRQYNRQNILESQLTEQRPTLPPIAKRRSSSQCNKQNRQKTLHEQKPSKPLNERYIQNKHQCSLITRSDRKIEKIHVLQEVSLKNFVIEGGKQYYQKENMIKKRESSYILKQKFAQIRKSIKLMDQNKENTNLKVIRYEN